MVDKHDRGELVLTPTHESEATMLPPWLPLKALNDFRDHRKALKAKMTPLAETKLINELARLRDEGNDPVAVLDQSILNGWKGVFPLKTGNSSARRDRGQSEAEKFARSRK